jgi:hypothetical protein
MDLVDDVVQYALAVASHMNQRDHLTRVEPALMGVESLGIVYSRKPRRKCQICALLFIEFSSPPPWLIRSSAAF